jgi:hypothetical protein
MANHGVFTVGTDLDEAFETVASLEKDCADYLSSRAANLPARADEPWNPSWLEPLAGEAGVWLSTAPYTRAWADLGRPLPAVLDDLAQLIGPRVAFSPQGSPSSSSEGAVLVPGGARVWGPDAEALAMVVDKAARAMLAGEGLGGAHPFPAWEAMLMRWVYRNSYAKLARKETLPPGRDGR